MANQLLSTEVQRAINRIVVSSLSGELDKSYADDKAARRKAIRVIRTRAACSYHRARETYDALSAAGLL